MAGGVVSHHVFGGYLFLLAHRDTNMVEMAQGQREHRNESFLWPHYSPLDNVKC